jgi:hypothetical protein
MVTAECPFLLLQRSKTFAPGATMIAMADNNADLHLLLFVHDGPLVHLIDLLHRRSLVFHAYAIFDNDYRLHHTVRDEMSRIKIIRVK